MIRVSSFAAKVQPSATLAAAAKAKQLSARGIKVYDFSLGEPDQPTPPHICAAAFDAMKAGYTHYTPAGGFAELKTAVAKWYRKFHGYEFAAEQVVISNGAKHSLNNALLATVGPGDEVIIPTPYWVSYSDLVSMTGAKPVLVNTTPASNFKLTPAQFRASCTSRTRLLMLNSPCNPTGTVYTRAELEALAQAVLETGAAILSDEIYEQLCYGDARPTCVATLRPELAERTITISGASKSYAMTGWRMGWAIAPVAIAKAMADVQSQQTGCPSSISQMAAIAALEGPQDSVAQMRSEYAVRRELVCGRLRRIPGIRLHDPDGAFYAFFDVSAYFGKQFGDIAVTDSSSFCNAALDGPHVNLVTGAAFGAEGYVRMSYAAARSELESGLASLEEWLAKAKH